MKSRARKSVFEIYKDRKGEWRYRLVAPNGQITNGPQEGYTRKLSCTRAVDRLRRAVAAAPIVFIVPNRPKKARK